MNTKPDLSYAGSWQYANNPGASIVNFYSTIELGASKAQGLVLAGWSYAGWDNQTFRTTNVAVLDQNPDGTLKLNTERYLLDPVINGAGSVIVSDFNQDGKDDIFLAAHNESPFVSKASSAYISTNGTVFQKLVVADAIEAHSASLGFLNGTPTVMTVGYGSSDPYYQFDQNTQSFDVLNWGNDYVYSGTYIKSFYGSAGVLGDFNNDGRTDLVVGDDKSSPGVDFVGTNPMLLAVYELSGGRLADQPAYKTTMYFDNNPKYSQRDSTMSGLSHTYRVWQDDFNHDGQQDLLAGVGIWSNDAGWSGAKLQMLQNAGNLQFADKTDLLANVFNDTATMVDYSMQQVDLDASGIESYLLADGYIENSAENGNYLLLNDGTGKLYAALHDEFMVWGAEVRNFLDSNQITYNKSLVAPKFIAYEAESGVLNYLAQWVGGNDSMPMVNVPVQYNITTDFIRDITVADRNSSMLLRTWAGDDTFYDANANANVNANASIDGGFGMDTAVYSGRLAQYALTGLTEGRFEVEKTLSQPGPLQDTLTNIERLRFSDATVALDVDKGEVAGSAYRIYKAAFDRIPDEGGLGFWINALDSGDSLVGVAQGFINSPEFKAMYGDNATDQHFVTLLYNHVLHRAPEGEGYQFWLNSLASGVSRAQVLKDFSESAENINQTAELVANGIQYQEYSA